MVESAKRQILASVTIDPGSITAASTLDVTATVPQARVGMVVTVNPPSTLNANVVVGGAWVSDNDEITIRLGNLTALAIDPGEATWLVALSY